MKKVLFVLMVVLSMLLGTSAMAQTRIRASQIDWVSESSVGVREAADGTRTAFTLNAENPIIGPSIKMYVNGLRNVAWTYSASTRVVTFTSAPANAAVIIADLETTRGTAVHRRLGAVRRMLLDSETSQVAWLNHGDSRGSWRHWRYLGSFYRQFNVKHAAVVIPAGVESNNGSRDGLGNFLVGGLTGVTNDSALPGETLTGSGVANIYPIDIGEAWTTGSVSNPNFGRYMIEYMTAGSSGAMDTTLADASTGGTFARGDPALGRNVASITRYLITDTRASWPTSYFEFGYNAESGAGTSSTFAPTAASSGLAIRTHALSLGATTGNLITVRHRLLSSSQTIGTGVITLATRIDYAGSAGMIYSSFSQGGWQSSDFRSPSLDADGKFTDIGYQSFVSTVIGTTKGVLRFEIGQNMTVGQWNGTTVGTYKADMEEIIDRAISNAVAGGMTEYVVLLVVPFRATGDDVGRINGVRVALTQLADENGWSMYDQQRELEDRGWATPNGSVLASMVEDGIHQTFLGMNEIGEAEYETLMLGE